MDGSVLACRLQFPLCLLRYIYAGGTGVLCSLCCSNASKLDFGFLFSFRVTAVSFFKAAGRHCSVGKDTHYRPVCPLIVLALSPNQCLALCDCC